MRQRILASTIFVLSVAIFAACEPDGGGSSNVKDVTIVSKTKGMQTIAGIHMVKIPGGTFQMGSCDGGDDELPIHKVTVSPFEMSATEVTVGQFRQFVTETRYQTEAERGDGTFVFTDGEWQKKADASWKKPYMEQDIEHPVVCVSWNDAMMFCKWMEDKTDHKYSLPTEAEWEYACRAGMKTLYYTGDTECDLARAGWYFGNSGDINLVGFEWSVEALKDSRCRTHPVGQKMPNTWGLYDMHGNVYEWCRDWYGDYSCGNELNPLGPETGSSHVKRGGGWGYDASHCRSAHRSFYPPDIRSSPYLGFRVVRKP